LRGTFLAIPVTLSSSSLLTEITLPRGSSSPKYFLAVSSVRTTDEGSERAAEGSPLISGNENILRKEGSTAQTMSS